MTIGAWIEFARHPSLKMLFLYAPLMSDTVTTVLDIVPTPFQSLTRLHIKIESKAFVRLIPHLFNLQDLSLEMDNRRSTAIFSELSHLRQLRHLSIAKVTVDDPDAILELAERCTNLTKLYVVGTGRERVSLNDTHIHHFAKLAPQIRDLSLQFRSRLSVYALRNLGEKCRRLDSCYLLGGINLYDLMIDGPPLFPNLSLLHVFGSEYVNGPTKALVPIIKFHLPKLRSIRTDSQAFDEGVMSALRKGHWEHMARLPAPSHFGST